MNFFYTTYQQTLERAEFLSGKAADPARPYDFKYEARAALESLRDSAELTEESALSSAGLGVIEYMLGVNYFETEEITESGKHFQRSLALFSSLPRAEQGRFINTVQDLFNSLGILCCNREDNAGGLKFFQKSESVYEHIKSLPAHPFSHSFSDFARGRAAFRFIIDGGISARKTEQNYTMCLFYMAQAYSQTAQKEKAALYCAETMKRQMEFGDYDEKDWAINCINMAEYYQDNNFFNAAMYVLRAGLSILPEASRKKLKSTLHMQIGRCYKAIMEHGMTAHISQTAMDDSVFASCVEFASVKVAFPRIVPPLEIEAAKELFKLGNTYLRESLEYFIVDGYVTEHIEMKRDISGMYKVLCYFESNTARIFAMTKRRLELLEDYTKELNKQSYSTLWQQLMNEVATVYVDLYDLKMESKKLSKAALTEATTYALTSIGKQTELLEYISKIELNNDTYQDIIQSSSNLMFGIAKLYSRLEGLDKEAKVGYMKESLKWYEKIWKYLGDTAQGKHADAVPDLQEQLRICEEMVGLLPIRISQFNATES